MTDTATRLHDLADRLCAARHLTGQMADLMVRLDREAFALEARTEVWTAGRGDDFTAWAMCTVCDWDHRELLGDHGVFELTVQAAEQAARDHLLTAH